MEASSVIGLRMLKIMTGNAAGQSEIHRMISEKIDAGLELQALALTGQLGFTPQSGASKVLSHYRRKVRANKRRLSKD